jgi:hypothetical protein
VVLACRDGDVNGTEGSTRVPGQIVGNQADDSLTAAATSTCMGGSARLVEQASDSSLRWPQRRAGTSGPALLANPDCSDEPPATVKRTDSWPGGRPDANRMGWVD